ncbi:hypothetical protein PoB_001615300 [Plakobranchus ocellatus]|uniref:Uncharacterized protein n=1 Tax=Plakobranchus ocellatus TaxID=259542 RepID=A0AAV3Z5B8_9GAST|nr:hypothetical protein PoB_001615300 [Plakobranchus ocellatus]
MKTALLACMSLVLLAVAFAQYHIDDKNNNYPDCTSVASGEKMFGGPCHRRRFTTDRRTGIRYCCEERGKHPVQIEVWIDAEMDYKYRCKCLTSEEEFSLYCRFGQFTVINVFLCIAAPESATTKSQLTKRTQQALALREHLLYASAPISCASILLCSDVLQSTVSAIRRVTVHGPVVRRAIDLSCRTLVISTSPTAARRLVLCPLASFQVNN